jgi:hypothetical protein
MTKPEQKGAVGEIIQPMSYVFHIYGSSYETCPVCGRKCAHGGETNATADEPVIRPCDWEIELYCAEHGHFPVLARNLIQPGEFFK